MCWMSMVRRRPCSQIRNYLALLKRAQQETQKITIKEEKKRKLIWNWKFHRNLKEKKDSNFVGSFSDLPNDGWRCCQHLQAGCCRGWRCRKIGHHHPVHSSRFCLPISYYIKLTLIYHFQKNTNLGGKGQNVENHFVESQKKNIESVKVFFFFFFFF